MAYTDNLEETPSRLQAVQVFLSLVDNSHLILVIGTKPPDILERFRQRGYEVVALEEDAERCKSLQEQGFNVVQGSPEDIGKTKLPRNIGAIWAGVAYAHTNESDFENNLRMLHLMLPTKGVLFIAVPYGEGEGQEEGKFVQSYNEEQFKELLVEQGFKVAHQEHTGVLLAAVVTR